MHKARAGIQTVEVGYALLGPLAPAIGPPMWEIGHATALAIWATAVRPSVHRAESAQASAPTLEDGRTQAGVLAHGHLPRTAQAVQNMLTEVQSRGIARAVDSPLPAMAGFCAPLFDFDRHMAPGIIALGVIAGLDTDRDGVVAQAPRGSAAQWAADLGHMA